MIEHGADVKGPDNKGVTPRDHAETQGLAKVAVLLSKQDCEADLQLPDDLVRLLRDVLGNPQNRGCVAHSLIQPIQIGQGEQARGTVDLEEDQEHRAPRGVERIFPGHAVEPRKGKVRSVAGGVRHDPSVEKPSRNLPQRSLNMEFHSCPAGKVNASKGSPRASSFSLSFSSLSCVYHSSSEP